jgi:PAS domain S-box-containing protein
VEEKVSDPRRIEARDWWLSATAVVVTLLLTSGIVLLTLTVDSPDQEKAALRVSVEGLIGIVLLFDLYVLYQRLQINRLRAARQKDDELFRLISENAADMITVVDVRGEHRYNSPSYERILGYSPDELRRVSAMELVHPEDLETVNRAFEDAKKGRPKTIEFRLRHKQGHWLQIESTANISHDDSGEVRRIILINRDIGPRKALEEGRSYVRRMESVERLSGGIAHEFNNLLGVILAFTEILQAKLEIGDSRYRDVEEIRLAGLRAAKLTKQLLTFGQQQQVSRVRLELNPLLSSMLPVLRDLVPAEINFQIDLHNQLPYIRADRAQLQQLIINLAINAGEAMPQGGILKFSTRSASANEIESLQRDTSPEKRHFICLEVVDNGIGIDQYRQQRMFEPFFSTKHQRSGLGLAVVLGIVQDNEGLIQVDSEPNRGTAIRMYFPACDEGWALEPSPEPELPGFTVGISEADRPH